MGKNELKTVRNCIERQQNEAEADENESSTLKFKLK